MKTSTFVRIGLIAAAAFASLPSAALTLLQNPNYVYDETKLMNLEDATFWGCANSTTETTEDATISFVGGSHFASGYFRIGNSLQPRTRTLSVNVTGQDTVFCAKNFSATATGTDRTDGGPLCEKVSVTDGARLTVSNVMQFTGRDCVYQELTVDDAMLEVLGSATFTCPETPANAHTTSVYFAGSAVSVPNGAIGFGTNGRDWNGVCPVEATGTVFTVGGLHLYHGSQGTFEDCVFNAGGLVFASGFEGRTVPFVRFRDCTVNETPLRVGYGTSAAVTPVPATAVFDGGSATFNAVDVGHTASATAKDMHPGHLVFTNGAQVVWNAGKANAYTVGHMASARLDIADSEVVVSDYPEGTIRVGYCAYATSACGEIRVGPGGVLDNGTMKIRLGCGDSGVGVLDVSGGTVKCGTVVVGDNTKEPTPSVLRVSSGILDASGSVVAGSYAGSSGTVILEGGILASARIAGGNGISVLEADGGTIRPPEIRDTDLLIGGISQATVGSGGLTLDIPFDGMYLTQSFTNKTGEAGVVVKTGSGNFELRPAGWKVAETVVAGGTLTVKGDYVALLETALVVTNGAVFSMADSMPQTLTLDALTVKDGTLELDPGDRIVVNGVADLSGLEIRLSSFPSENEVPEIQAISFTEGSAEAFTEELTRWTDMIGGGLYGLFETVTADGVTRVVCTVVPEAEALGEDQNTVWQPDAAGSWGDSVSWNNGAPVEGKRAVFPAADTARTVDVPADAVLTALSLDGLWTLAGGTLGFRGERGALAIDVLSGDAAVSAALSLEELTDVDVAAGASLALSGKITGGGLRKRGSGKLTLASESGFNNVLDIGGGMTVVGSSSNIGDAGVTMRRDTLEIDSPDGSLTEIDGLFTVSCETVSNSVIVKTDTPAVIRNFVSQQGGFIKRGVAPLTIEVHDGDVLAAEDTLGGEAQGFVEFPPDGSSPVNSAKNFNAVTVAEGEVIIKAADGETLPRVDASGDDTYLALKNTNGTVRARLTVDGVHYDASGCKIRVNGHNSGNNSTSTGKITLREELLKGEMSVINGAKVTAGYLYLNHFGNKQGMSPTLALTNATFNASVEVRFSYSIVNPSSLNATSVARVRAKDSTLSTAKYYNMFTVDADFDNSVMEGNSFDFLSGSAGQLVFRNGSVFAVPKLTFTTFRQVALKGAQKQKLVFDGGEWRYGEGDYTFDPEFLEGAGSEFVIEMQGDGIKLAPAAGTVFTTLFPFTGEGGLKVTGEGTVAFGAGALAFTGPIDAGEGTVDLSQAGEVSGATFAAGRIYGGNLKNVNIAFDAGDDWSKAGGMPLFDGCTFGRVTVDCGRDASTALPIPLVTPVCVAEFTGAEPDVSGWRIKGTGVSGVWGKFTVSEGKVMMTASRLGFSVIIR